MEEPEYIRKEKEDTKNESIKDIEAALKNLHKIVGIQYRPKDGKFLFNFVLISAACHSLFYLYLRLTEHITNEEALIYEKLTEKYSKLLNNKKENEEWSDDNTTGEEWKRKL